MYWDKRGTLHLVCYTHYIIYSVAYHMASSEIIKPSYTYWAPWIGQEVRIGDEIKNTEHWKCHKVEDDEELGDFEIGEDRLV